MLKKTCLDVHAKIVEQNARMAMDSIPHSDSFFKLIQSMLGVEVAEVKRLIGMLKEAHFILSIEIVKEDKKNEIKRVEGYIDTSLPNIKALKNLFQKALMDDYERQFHKRLMVHQIVKEIYSRGSSFSNTPLGQTANKAIMLEEYENLMEKEYAEFTETWKENKLNEIIGIYETERFKAADSTGGHAAAIEPDKPSVQTGRAIDTYEYKTFSQGQNRSMKKMISIYGIEFFFRVNLRNCNFDNISSAIENREIDRRADLKLLKDMIHKMKMNMEIDARLAKYSDEIHRLERLVSRNI